MKCRECLDEASDQSADITLCTFCDDRHQLIDEHFDSDEHDAPGCELCAKERA